MGPRVKLSQRPQARGERGTAPLVPDRRSADPGAATRARAREGAPGPGSARRSKIRNSVISSEKRGSSGVWFLLRGG